MLVRSHPAPAPCSPRSSPMEPGDSPSAQGHSSPTGSLTSRPGTAPRLSTTVAASPHVLTAHGHCAALPRTPPPQSSAGFSSASLRSPLPTEQSHVAPGALTPPCLYWRGFHHSAGRQVSPAERTLHEGKSLAWALLNLQFPRKDWRSGTPVRQTLLKRSCPWCPPPSGQRTPLPTQQ